MGTTKVTHVGFSDESNWNAGRFRSLGLITTSLMYLGEIDAQLNDILSKSEVKEFKWNKLNGAKERFAAQKMCDFVIEKALQGKLRVDVLIWDIQDRRHNVVGRDDIANLQRMYYHLFRNTLRLRWPDDAVWRLHPDEHTAIQWETIQDYLEATSQHLNIESSLFEGGGFRIRLKKDFALEDIQSVCSSAHPLLQVADLFAGMAVFSREKFEHYKSWLAKQSSQSCFLEDELTTKPSQRDQERFQVLRTFDEACKRRKLGVSLNRKRGLWTPKPDNPINFWMYEPQRPEDKAPVKERKL